MSQMTKALKWIRKSKGSEDDIGLEDQREKVADLADRVADDVDELDLGIQTGFSSITRDPDRDDLLDYHPEVEDALDRLKSGEYDYLVALDDERVSRDDYFSVIKHAMRQGDAEFVYVREVPEDDLTHDIQRRVERQTKEDEIQKSEEALKRRRERGYDHGRPRYGMTYDEAKQYQVPGEDFDKVENVIEQRQTTDKSFAEIADEVGIATGTAHNIWNRREWYAERSDIELADSTDPSSTPETRV